MSPSNGNVWYSGRLGPSTNMQWSAVTVYMIGHGKRRVMVGDCNQLFCTAAWRWCETCHTVPQPIDKLTWRQRSATRFSWVDLGFVISEQYCTVFTGSCQHDNFRCSKCFKHFVKMTTFRSQWSRYTANLTSTKCPRSVVYFARLGRNNELSHNLACPRGIWGHPGYIF